MDSNLYCKWLIMLSVMVIMVRTSTASSGDYEWRETVVTRHDYDYIAMKPYGGSCGYGDSFGEVKYTWATVALSTALFNEGHSCGHCFDIRCDPVKSKNCSNAGTYTVTATDLCPPDREGGWCSPSKVHLDLSAAVLTQMTWQAYVFVDTLPVFYRRAPCKREGGLKFKLVKNDATATVYVLNVAGVGEVKSVDVRSEFTSWVHMTPTKPPTFQSTSIFHGHIISFRVTSTTGQTVDAINVIPYYWRSGDTYQGNVNFNDSMPDSLNFSKTTSLSE